MVTRWLFLPALGLYPGLAWSHSPIQGLDDFFNGVLHPLFVPAHILLVLVFGLQLGQQGVQAHLRAIWLYVTGVALGLVSAGAASSVPYSTLYEAAVLAAAAGVGLLAVSALRVSRLLTCSIGLVAGLMLGLDSLQAELTGKARYVALFGSAVGLYLLLLYPLALAEWAQRRVWLGIGVRVVASWLVASALLVLALLFAPAA